MTVHRKLVRDGIPAIISAEGRRPVVEVLAPEQRCAALLAKLVEEAREAADAGADEVMDELADVFEVLRATAAELGRSMADVTAVADRKRDERGGFDGGIFLVEVV